MRTVIDVRKNRRRTQTQTAQERVNHLEVAIFKKSYLVVVKRFDDWDSKRKQLFVT